MSNSPPEKQNDDEFVQKAQRLNGSKAQWDEEDSRIFADYGNYFVPFRQAQIDTICDLIPVPERAELFHVVELCCGEGSLSQALLDRFTQCYVHGFDGSATMIERAKLKLAGYGVRFDAKLFELSSVNWREFPWPVQAVVSSLAIHHLSDRQKLALFRDMAHNLIPGGVIIIADLVLPTTYLGVNLAAKAWDEAVKHRALQLDGTLKAYEYFREVNWNLYSDPEPDPADKPASLFKQLNWLIKAGFTSVDVFWMKAGHAIFGGQIPKL